MRHFKDMKVICLMILGLFALGIIVNAQEGRIIMSMVPIPSITNRYSLNFRFLINNR